MREFYFALGYGKSYHCFLLSSNPVSYSNPDDYLSVGLYCFCEFYYNVHILVIVVVLLMVSSITIGDRALFLACEAAFGLFIVVAVLYCIIFRCCCYTCNSLCFCSSYLFLILLFFSFGLLFR